MSKKLKSSVFLIVFIAGGFFAVYSLSNFLERRRPALPENYADEDLTLQGAKLKGFALGFEGLLADWYWIKSLQYLGDKAIKSGENLNLENLKTLNPRLLYPYLNNATDLDPKFISVYEYGATVLPAIDQEQAIALTKKGISNNPENWRLYHYLGYIYWRLEDYEKAAAIYEQGAKIAGAPDFMRMMAAKMRSNGGNRETARAVYQEIFAEAQDEQTRENARLRLLELDSLDEREAMQKSLNDLKTKNNRCVNNLREILPVLQTVKLPNGRDFRLDNANNLIDPTGAPYILNKNQCVVELDAQKTKIPAK